MRVGFGGGEITITMKALCVLSVRKMDFEIVRITEFWWSTAAGGMRPLSRDCYAAIEASRLRKNGTCITEACMSANVLIHYVASEFQPLICPGLTHSFTKQKPTDSQIARSSHTIRLYTAKTNATRNNRGRQQR